MGWLLHEAEIHAPVVAVGLPSGVLAGGEVEVHALWSLNAPFRAAELEGSGYVTGPIVQETGIEFHPEIPSWQEVVTTYTWQLIFASEPIGEAGAETEDGEDDDQVSRGVVFVRHANGFVERFVTNIWVDANGNQWRYLGERTWTLTDAPDVRLNGPVRVDGSLVVADANVSFDGIFAVRDDLETTGLVRLVSDHLDGRIYIGGEGVFQGPVTVSADLFVGDDLYIGGVREDRDDEGSGSDDDVRDEEHSAEENDADVDGEGEDDDREEADNDEGMELERAPAAARSADCRIDGTLVVVEELEIRRACITSAPGKAQAFASPNGILVQGLGLAPATNITVHDVVYATVPGRPDLANPIVIAEIGATEPTSVRELFLEATAVTSVHTRDLVLLIGRDPQYGPPDMAVDTGRPIPVALAGWPELYQALTAEGYTDLDVGRVFVTHDIIMYVEVLSRGTPIGIYLLREGASKVTATEADIAAYYYALEASLATLPPEKQRKLRARWRAEWLLAMGAEVDDALIAEASFPEEPYIPPPEEQGVTPAPAWGMTPAAGYVPPGGVVYEASDGSRQAVYLPLMKWAYQCHSYSSATRNYRSCGSVRRDSSRGISYWFPVYIQSDYNGQLWATNGCSPTAAATALYYIGKTTGNYQCVIEDPVELITRLRNEMGTPWSGTTYPWRIDHGMMEAIASYGPSIYVSETVDGGLGSNSAWKWVADKIAQGRPTVFSQNNMVVNGTQVDHTVVVVGIEWRRVERLLGDQVQRYFKIFSGWDPNTTMIRFDSYTPNAGYTIDRVTQLSGGCPVSGGGSSGGGGGGGCALYEGTSNNYILLIVWLFPLGILVGRKLSWWRRSRP